MNRVTLNGRAVVLIDGEPLRLHPSLELRNHSPTGFSWGYAGSGPSQLALALLLHVTKNKEVSLRHYQAFKFEHVASWPWENHAQEHDVDIQGWVNGKETQNARHDSA